MPSDDTLKAADALCASEADGLAPTAADLFAPASLELPLNRLADGSPQTDITVWVGAASWSAVGEGDSRTTCQDYSPSGSYALTYTPRRSFFDPRSCAGNYPLLCLHT